MPKEKSKYPPGKHPNSQKNLKRWEPGQSGNPNGRPGKTECITHIQREMLSKPCPYAQGKTWAQWLARRGLELAGENPAYYRELLDRLEGKVTQPIEGQITTDVVFTIGKGYANGKPDIQSDKQDAG
jgi:hypothetical protein